jgi:hypothetical protein
MATTTTNFGWDIPQSTDLVKDGATAIAALGQDIDTALVDLKGGTTGQILAKASNTDLDYSWVTTDDANAIQNSIVDAKGDIVAASANDTPARLAVGANNTTLLADSAEATGLKWVSPKIVQVVSSSYQTLTASSSTTYADTGLTATITPKFATSTILVLVNQNGVWKSAGSSANAVNIRLLRGATNLTIFAGEYGYTGTALELLLGSASATYMDSPATTSATTYKTQFANRVGAASVQVQTNSGYSTMVLLEIGA